MSDSLPSINCKIMMTRRKAGLEIELENIWLRKNVEATKPKIGMQFGDEEALILQPSYSRDFRHTYSIPDYLGLVVDFDSVQYRELLGA